MLTRCKKSHTGQNVLLHMTAWLTPHYT